MVNSYTAVILILSITPSSTVILPVFSEKVVHWFNESNRSNFEPSTKELLFGILNSPGSSCKKLNNTVLFMRYYIYKRKLNEEALLLQDFIKRIKQKYILT